LNITKNRYWAGLTAYVNYGYSTANKNEPAKDTLLIALPSVNTIYSGRLTNLLLIVLLQLLRCGFCKSPEVIFNYM